MLGSQEHSAVPPNYPARQIPRQVQRAEMLAHWEKPESSSLPVAPPPQQLLLGVLFYLTSFCDCLLSDQGNPGLEEFFKITALSVESHQDAEEVFRTLQEILKD